MGLVCLLSGIVRLVPRRKRDSNPRNSYPFTAFRVRPVRPLRHFSSDWSTAKLRRIFLPAKAQCQKMKKPNGHAKKEFALWRRKSVRAERNKATPRAKEWGRMHGFSAVLAEFSKRLAEISASTADFRGMRLCVSGCDKGRFFSIREELQSVCGVSRMVKQKTPPTACVVGGAMKGGPEWAFR